MYEERLEVLTKSLSRSTNDVRSESLSSRLKNSTPRPPSPSHSSRRASSDAFFIETKRSPARNALVFVGPGGELLKDILAP